MRRFFCFLLCLVCLAAVPADALAAAPSIRTITLKSDREALRVKRGESVLLNLNNHKISAAGKDHAVVVEAGAVLRVTGTGFIENSKGGSLIWNEGSVMVEGGTWQQSCLTEPAVVNHGYMEIDTRGSFVLQSTDGPLFENGWRALDGSDVWSWQEGLDEAPQLLLCNGEFVGGYTTVDNKLGGVCMISGGHVRLTYSVLRTRCKAEISGGHFLTWGPAVVAGSFAENGSALGDAGLAEVRISGGYFALQTEEETVEAAPFVIGFEAFPYAPAEVRLSGGTISGYEGLGWQVKTEDGCYWDAEREQILRKVVTDSEGRSELPMVYRKAFDATVGFDRRLLQFFATLSFLQVAAVCGAVLLGFLLIYLAVSLLSPRDAGASGVTER